MLQHGLLLKKKNKSLKHENLTESGGCFCSGSLLRGFGLGICSYSVRSTLRSGYKSMLVGTSNGLSVFREESCDFTQRT